MNRNTIQNIIAIMYTVIIPVLISQYSNESLLPEYNVILQYLIYCNSKNHFTVTVILLYNTSTVILDYVLLIKFHYSIVKLQEKFCRSFNEMYKLD